MTYLTTSAGTSAKTNYFEPRYDYWRKFDTLKAWEIASLMHGVDPHTLTDLLVGDPLNPLDKIGVPLDISEEIRMLVAACNAEAIKRVGDHNLPDDSAEITVESLIPWLTEKGHGQLAKALLGERATSFERDAMLLARLRALGGDVRRDSRSGKWKVTGIGKLQQALEEEGEKLDPKTLRRYLNEAADREVVQAREGIASKRLPRGVFDV